MAESITSTSATAPAGNAAENNGGDPKQAVSSATGENAVSTPDTAQAEKTFTQAEVDKMIKDKLAREKKKAEPTAQAAPESNPEIQAQLNSLMSELRQANIEKAAMTEATALGIDAKAVPYIIKMADMSAAYKDDKINVEAIKSALSKVLEDLPQFKPQLQEQQKGFKIGSAGQVQGAATAQSQKATQKRWNRFN